MQSSVPGSVSFRHGVLRQASHDSLPSRRRRQLHAAIAERYVDSGDVSDVELAFHYEQADMLAEACSCARAAGLAAEESELQLDAAEVPVVIAFQRAAGQLDVLAGVIGSGWERLEGLLGSARDHGLLYDESLWLLAAVVPALLTDRDARQT